MSTAASLKAHCNRLHARHAAAERHGVVLTPLDIRVIEAMIREGHGDARCVAPDANGLGRPLHAVRWDGRWLPVCYDPATQSVITVLPDRVLDPYLAVLDPVALSPAPPPEPEPEPEPARKPRAPFVGRVVGWMPLPPTKTERQQKIDQKAGAGALRDLPEVPDVPEDAAPAAYEAALAALAQRRDEVVIRTGWDHPKAGRVALVVEISRLGEQKRDLLRRKHVAYTRQQIGERADRLGVDADDPVDVVRCLYRALGSIGGRIGWSAFHKEEQDARNLAKEYLKVHALKH
jgi:hypothetical protein